MIYSQFENRTAKCKNVRIENNIKEEVLSDIKKLTKAGVIYIVYAKNKSELAKSLESTVSRAGYNVQIMPYTEDMLWEELECNCEGLVLLGSAPAQYYNGKKCISITDNLDLYNVLHKEYYSVIVDINEILNFNCNQIAAGYGGLMNKLAACFDYRIYCISYSNNLDLDIVEEIQVLICDLFNKNYLFNYDSSFVRDLTATIVNVGLLEGMLEDSSILNGYDICSKLVKNVAKSNHSVNEFAMLVGWFAVNTIKSLIKRENKDLFLPCDIMSDIDFVSEKGNVPRLELLKLTDKIVANEYIRLSFISQEYAAEIKKYIDSIYLACCNAMKNFRRIYYDAGLEIAASITMKELSECVLKGLAFNPQYSYLKMLRIVGAA